MNLSPASVKGLLTDLARFEHDPWDFVNWNYPWGTQGGPLQREKPRKWQKDYLCAMRDRLKGWSPTNPNMVDHFAVCSGHGIGKSALLAWLIEWAVSTREDTRGFVTAGTEGQLLTKTWPELSRWHRMGLARHLFELTATSYHLDHPDPGRRKNWSINIQPWNQSRPEAGAGLHNKGGRVAKFFDEASQIPDPIWETAAGAETDSHTEIIQHVYGNPTRKNGYFYEITHGDLRERWESKTIDSRTVEGTNLTLFKEWEEDYGVDSDFFKVRVRGLPPSASNLQFIPDEFFEKASRREARPVDADPVVAALDVARGGDAHAVMRFRWGDNMRDFDPIRIPGSEVKDSSKLFALVADVFRNPRVYGLPRAPDAFIVDANGVGAGLFDALLRAGFPVLEFVASAASPDRHYANLRAYGWAQLRTALRLSASVDPADKHLRRDIGSQEYIVDARDRVQLVKKEHMMKAGIDSPDDGDAASMLWVFPVESREASRTRAKTQEREQATTGRYDAISSRREQRREARKR